MKEFRKTLAGFKSDPAGFYREVLGVDTLEEYQVKALKTIAGNERTAIAACHDLGKTFIVARLVPWFLSCYPYSKIITTAPTYNQVKNILWSEIRTAKNRAKFPIGGDANQTEWKIDEGWFALGFTPRSEADAGGGQGTQSSFQGFHAEGGVLVIFDEATGIPHNIWTMAEGLLTSANVRFVAIGNPTSRDSEFYQCFKSPAWAKIYLTCFDSPNLIASGIRTIEELKAEVELVRTLSDADAKARLDGYKVVTPYLLTTKWVVQNVLRWGYDHPLTVAKIFGRFPEAGDNTLISLGYIERAQLRVYFPTPADRKSIGVDVARFGADSSVLTSLHGVKQLGRKELYQHNTQSVVGETINMSREIGGADIIVVDETGLGGGVVDLLTEEIGNSLPKNCEVRGVQFGATCDDEADKEKYVNLKARMAGLLRDDLKRDDGLALLNESVYLEEIPTIRFQYNKKGQLVIESKDEYKKRTGRKSPDSFDSLALANYGHYDELKIGKFIREANRNNPAPRASGLGSTKRNW